MKENWLFSLGSKNDMRNSENFNASSGKSENLHIDLLPLSKAYSVSAEKVQKNYLSWHWKIQTLKKNWFFIWKMSSGLWWTLTRAVESLKICSLIGCFCRKYVMFELKNTEKLCRKKLLLVSKMTEAIWWIFT